MRYTPEHITTLQPNEIFVFGSNILGNHYGGAANMAYQQWDYPWGRSFGLQGQCFAIPTCDSFLLPLPFPIVKFFIEEFLLLTNKFSHLTFLVTPIGCGIACFRPEDIASLFKDYPNNVILPESFIKIIK
jgi:hypothetical protein